MVVSHVSLGPNSFLDSHVIISVIWGREKHLCIIIGMWKPTGSFPDGFACSSYGFYGYLEVLHLLALEGIKERQKCRCRSDKNVSCIWEFLISDWLF